LPKQALNQSNAFGLGIGTFNDRLRDSARGGNFSHDTVSDQGFINGLYYDYNHSPVNSETPADLAAQKETLLNYTDIIKLGLAGNLRDYKFINHNGKLVRGSEVNYRGNPGAGYAAGPTETINYIDAHDNYSLWDQITAKAPFHLNGRNPVTATPEEKARMQDLGLSIIALGQGIPFFQAGSDMLRSKSGDGDSYDSGDWFNRLDFTYGGNNWGIGLPPEWRNKKEWQFWQPRLAEPGMAPSKETITSSVANFQKILLIRKSSGLFHLPTAADIIERVRFIDTPENGPAIPGLIAMQISDKTEGRENLDQERRSVLVIFNATRETKNFQNNGLKNRNLKLYPVLKEDFIIENSTGKMVVPADPYMKQTVFDPSSGTIVIPPRSTVVYYEPEEN
jgi:pullulanase